MKPIAAEVRLAEIETLDLGAHRPVDEQDALARGASQRCQGARVAREVRVWGWIG